jgi:hypothetical protein
MVLVPAVAALGQESESTTVTTTTTTIGGPNLTSDMWNVDDATTLETGRVELRFTYRWITAGYPANNGDSSDDHIVTPGIVWGAADNLELFANVPTWVGDGGDRPAFDYGNYDPYVGLTWRLADQDGMKPATALRFTARVPACDNSQKSDVEGRLIFTNEYDSGIRSHFNAFAITANGNDAPPTSFDDGDGFFGLAGGLGFLFGDGAEYDRRHFQWGFVFGMDGPLCADGAVRWVLDYMHRSSEVYGRNNTQILEAGWEWDIDDCNKFSMGVQVGVDRIGDTPNFGTTVNYTRALTY